MKWTLKGILTAVVLMLIAGATAYAEGGTWWDMSRAELQEMLGAPERVEDTFDVYLKAFYDPGDIIYVYYQDGKMVGVRVLTRPTYFRAIVEGFATIYGDWTYGYPESRHGYIWELDDRIVDVSYYNGIVAVFIDKRGL